MPGTTPNNAFRYPLATEAPDGPGAILALATDLDGTIQTGTWLPGLGGTGATMGANYVQEGSYMRLGKNVTAKGRITFGSGASFGSGFATITSLPGAILLARSGGTGVYIPATGNPIPVFFRAIDGANLNILPVRGNAAGSLADLVPAFNIGTPAQSTELRFTLDLTLA